MPAQAFGQHRGMQQNFAKFNIPLSLHLILLNISTSLLQTPLVQHDFFHCTICLSHQVIVGHIGHIWVEFPSPAGLNETCTAEAIQPNIKVHSMFSANPARK
jgi:hypothetical protein